MAYNGRRGPNVSEYIANLNAIPSAQDIENSQGDFDLDEDLAMFTNTQFFDSDLNQFADLQPTDFGDGHGRASIAGEVSDMKSMDFDIPGMESLFLLYDMHRCLYLLPFLHDCYTVYCLVETISRYISLIFRHQIKPRCISNIASAYQDRRRMLHARHVSSCSRSAAVRVLLCARLEITQALGPIAEGWRHVTCPLFHSRSQARQSCLLCGGTPPPLVSALPVICSVITIYQTKAEKNNYADHVTMSTTGDFNFPDFGSFAAPSTFGADPASIQTTTIPPYTDASSPTAGPSPSISGEHKRKASSSDAPDFEEASRQAAEEDKRRRNTAASARFRVKKKQREAALERSAKDMSDKVAALEGRINQLETENKWLKNLITEKNESNEDIAALWKKYNRESAERKGSQRKDGVGTKA